MYSVDHRDSVVRLADFPQFSSGAPCPILLHDEHTCVLAAYVQPDRSGWTGTSARMVNPSSSDDLAAIVAFHSCRAVMFGPPNDEAFHGHPLASRGLDPHGSYEVIHSSWIRSLEQMNRVHPQHSAAAFADLRHFVVAFHDSTFECIATRYTIQSAMGPMGELVGLMARARKKEWAPSEPGKQ